MSSDAADNKPYVGGQAVIEGVMMRSPRSMAVAVRRANGTIVVVSVCVCAAASQL